ncbi:MAG: hypothetical protein ABWZ74_06810 [Hyphomicrobiaceae bacterium]
MSRSTYRRCRACGAYHWTDDWPDNHVEPEADRSPLAAPNVISDTMPAVMSMGDGKMYDSKSAIRAHYKRDGFTEVGNERPKPKAKPKVDTKGIADSVDKALARLSRGEKPKGMLH